MTASAYINQAARAAAAKRPFNLTMLGIAAAWQAEESAIMAARPADATARCACCEDTYATKALKALDSDWVYTQVMDRELASFERDDRLCPRCRASLMSEVGAERVDTYNINDVLYGHDVDF